MRRALYILVFLAAAFPVAAQERLQAPPFEVPFPTGAMQKDLDTISARMVRRIAVEPVDWAAAARALQACSEKGEWADVNYSLDAPGFPIMPHLRRMVLLSRSYADARSPLCGKPEVLVRLRAAFDRYLTWYGSSPRIDNWWYRDIGAPQEYADALLLLKGALEPSELQRLGAYLEDRTVNWAHRGKNRTWVSMISLAKACTLDDVPLAERAVASIASTMEIAPRQGDEGLKVDGSIHQHRPQLYSGGYGMSLVGDLSEYISLTGGTAFRPLFTLERCDLLSYVLLDGTRLLGYRGAVDFGVIGRGIARQGNGCNIDASVVERMAGNDTARAEDFRAWKTHLTEFTPFPAPGNKHFWCSDMMTDHGANYYLSVKIPSARSVGTEQLNRENLKGFNLPMGATNILTHGREYFDVFPLWDWTKVPGVTAIDCADSARLEGYMFGKNEFGGGVSDGRDGLMAFEYDYKGLKARKAYFLFGERMLCIGNSIASRMSHSITTSLNQCFLRGEVDVWNDANVRNIPAESSDHMAAPCRIWHDGVAYLVPSGNVRLETLSRSGYWSDLAEPLEDSTPEVRTGKVFALWLDHGTQPQGAQYCYVVAPDVSRESAATLPVDGGFRVLENTPQRITVRNSEAGVMAVVFFAPGTADLGDGVRLTSDSKALVMLRREAEAIVLSYSDPLYYRPGLTLTVNGRELKLDFPRFPNLGRTTTIKLK